MKKSTKILVLLLSLTLVIAGLAIAVSAAGTPGATYVNENDETVNASTLSEAVANAKEGTTITLTGDTSVDAVIAVNKNLTLDLGGYTITNEIDKRFEVKTNGKTFTVTGEGAINSKDIFISVVGGVNANAGIIGTQGGIDITFDNSSRATTDNVRGRFIYLNAGTFNMENVNIVKAATYGNQGFIHTGGDSEKCYVNLNNVKANLLFGGSTDGSNTQKGYLAYVGHKTQVNITSSNIATTGSIFYLSHANDSNGKSIDTGNYANIVHSSISASYHLVENNYQFHIGTLVAKDSFISIGYGNGRNIIKETTVKLENSCLYFAGGQGGSNSFVLRSHKVELDENSSLILKLARKSEIYDPSVDNHTNNSKMYFEVGTRIDANAYATIQSGYTRGLYFKADGKKVDAEDAGYVFVYEPEGNPYAPYMVVAKADADKYTAVPPAAPTYENQVKYYDAPPANPGTGYLAKYSGAMPYYYDVSNGGWDNVNNATKLQLTSDNPNGIQSYFMESGTYYQIADYDSSKQQSPYDLIIMEFDIGTDSPMGFPEGLSLYVRAHQRAGNYWDGGAPRAYDVVKPVISSSGLVSCGDKSIQMNIDTWNHVTIIADPGADSGVSGTFGLIYYYINGELLCSAPLAKNPTVKGTGDKDVEQINLYGVVLNNGLRKDYGASVIVNDLVHRTYAVGTVADGYDPASYLTAGGKSFYEGENIRSIVMAGGNYLSGDINDIIAYCEENSLTPELYRDLKHATITSNVTIKANGYAIEPTEDSYGFLIEYDEAGNPVSYTFNEEYNSKVYFRYGDAVYEAKIGMVPAGLIDASVPSRMKKINGIWMTQKPTGSWTTVEDGAKDDILHQPITEEYLNAHKEETIDIYPVYSSKQDYAIAVEDINGNFARGYGDTAIYGSQWRASISLQYGETLVLQKDITSQTAMDWEDVNGDGVKNKIDRGAGNGNPEVLGIDLNGFTLKLDRNHYQPVISPKIEEGFIKIYAGETLNVYSSREGGMFKSYGVEKTYKNPSGNKLFSLETGANIEEYSNPDRPADNTEVNIGTVTVGGNTYPGSNLSIYASLIMDARGGDASCKVNIDGITAVRNSGDFPGLFVTRYYFGEFNITNCKIFSINAVVLCLHSNGVSETFKSANGTVNIDNCDIITNDSGNAGIFSGSDRLTEMTVNIYNSRVNGHINNPGGKVYIHENTIFNSATANIASGLVKAGWNVAMDIGADTVSYEYFTVNKEVTQTNNPKGEGYGALYNYINYVVARNGYEGEANMYLSAIAYKAVKAEDAVTVTYNGIGGAAADVPYAVGGNVTDYKLPNYNSAAFTLAHNGKYIEEYAKGVTKDGTYVYTADTAYYTAEANVTGLQANVSLYADFGINLYIPAAYANLVTVEGQALVSALSGQYLKATAKVTCDKAADAVTFVLNVAETIDGVEYTDTCTVTVSLVDYANAILGGEYTDADKVLVYYMMNYANEAANYFGEGAEAIAAIVANNKAAIEAIYIPDAATDEAIKNMGISDVITAVSVGENEGKLAFAFNLVEGFEGTITVSYAKGAVTKTITVVAGQEMVYLGGIKAYNFGTVLTISAEGSVNGEAVTVTGGQFSLDTYVQNLRNTETVEDYEALAEALKAYADVSDLYKNKTLADAIEAFAEANAPEAPEVEDVPAEDDTPVSDGEEV